MVTQIANNLSSELSPNIDFYQSTSESETCRRRTRSSLAFSAPLVPRSSSTSSGNGTHRRKSVFTEVGLGGADDVVETKTPKLSSRPRRQVRSRSKADIHEASPFEEEEWTSVDAEDDFVTPSANMPRLMISVPPSPFPSMSRCFLLAFMLAFIVPTLHNSPFLGNGFSPIGVKGGVIKQSPRQEIEVIDGELVRRQNAATEVCKRWSQQTAIVNGTLYLYGGRSITDASQTRNTWSKQHSVTVHLLC